MKKLKEQGDRLIPCVVRNDYSYIWGQNRKLDNETSYSYVVDLCLCVGNERTRYDKCVHAMPDQYIPQLEHAWRKDLVDLYTSGKESRLKNTMNGFSTSKANERLPFATDYGA